MNATLSLLGTAMLILVGVAVVLAAVILILYEARWIMRLGSQLFRSATTTEPAGPPGEVARDEHGGA